MDKFVINGGKQLSGSVKTDGSKNAALPIVVASMLIDHGETIHMRGGTGDPGDDARHDARPIC